MAKKHLKFGSDQRVLSDFVIKYCFHCFDFSFVNTVVECETIVENFFGDPCDCD